MTKFSGAQQSQLAQIGAFLREKREQQGKSLQDIATSTYIRPQLLSGIETGNPDLLPEPIFVQGFIRRYAEVLGLKGVELSQQFTVDSIPSTPRPTKASSPEDSSTTRLTRLSPKAVPQQPTTGVPIFEPSALDTDFLAPSPQPEPELIKSEPVERSLELEPNLEPELTPSLEPEQSLELSFEEPSLLASDTEEDIPVVPLNTGLSDNLSDDLNVFSFTNSSSAADSHAVSSHSEVNSTRGNGLVTNGSVENGLHKNGSDKLPAFETDNLETNDLDTGNLETAGIELETSNGQVVNDEPSPFVSDLPPAKQTPTNEQLMSSPISYTRSTPSDLDTSQDAPNLKPFAIGAVVVAALTAGIVVLANILGGEPSPTVADSVAPIEAVEPEEPSALPTLPDPEPAPAPPVSDAPLFLEVEVTEPAWTSVTADGGNSLFEGTLNPGDSLVWEAQNSITVFSGNPGGLQISQNGQPAEALGESGIPSGKDYSVQ